MRILFDPFDCECKSPFGPVARGETARFCIKIPLSCKTRRVFLVLLAEDGEEYARFAMKKTAEESPYEAFSCHLSLEEGLYFYYFAIETEGELFSLYRQGLHNTNMEEGALWQLSCIPADFTTPAPFAGKVLYQIFPDRFARKGTSDLTEKITPFTLHESTAEIPSFLPDETGEVKNCDFFGGNLRGIEEKLPYLASLGVGVIYLNPIFKAWSNHRYDTADYKKIDEMLGTEEDFASLCRAAHARGIRIVLDGVFSHTGSHSRYFDIDGRFSDGAYHNPDSPYRAWYDFHPNGTDYTSWWGITTLPCTSETDESFQRFIIDAEDSVLAHWTALGADGWRLDVADELPDSFIARLRRRLKALKPDSLLIGEVWEDASNKISYGARRTYFTAGELDSVMNYPLRAAILDFVLGKDDGTGLEHTLMTQSEHYPAAVLSVLMNMLSTHDTPRLLSLLSPDPPPETKEERARYRMPPEARSLALRRFRCAVFLQFTAPGMPCIYYGDEIGTEGWEDPFCRTYFDWSRTETDLTDLYRRLAALREEHEALKRGDLRAKKEAKGHIRMIRTDGEKALSAHAASGDPVSLPVSGRLLFSEGATLENGLLTLAPYGFALVED